METQITTTRTALKYGLVVGVASMIYSTIVNVSGQVGNQSLGYLSLLILIVGIVLAMREFKADSAGFMSYGQGLGIGAMLSGVSGFISAVYAFIYNEFIDPTLPQQAMDKARSDMENRGMDDAQIDASMAIAEKFSSPSISFFVIVIFSIIAGFIISLVVSAVMKKEKPFELE